MSKSRNNAIMLGASEDDTAKLLKKAKTDSQRHITYDPANRPEVANLLLIASLCTGQKPEDIAQEIGEGGSGKLKSFVTDALNEQLRELRKRRCEFAKDKNRVSQVLKKGIAQAREMTQSTLAEVRKVMNMEF